MQPARVMNIKHATNNSGVSMQILDAKILCRNQITFNCTKFSLFFQNKKYEKYIF